ncbi:histone deacetylase 15-like [Olea europaea var. sylvestris]|uniref:histone deacetylase 15-like n=1 Tax=Olea europaea var. sylvestris TaxID=158386 RepID=UPI000C1D4576|nr:histone deacetylase 15-like [Olea europaea var. sylvestris]
MTEMCSVLSGGKLLVILEGGYNLRSISSSATAVIKVLLGESPKCNLDYAVPTNAGLRTVLEVLKIQTKYWPALETNFSKLQSEWGSYAFHHSSIISSKLFHLPLIFLICLFPLIVCGLALCLQLPFSPRLFLLTLTIQT